MTTEPVRKKSIKNAAIILLTPPYGIKSDNLIKNLRKTCQNNKWSLIKTIQIQGPTDVSALYKLTRRIASWSTKPVNIILDREFSNSHQNILACCCLGTLYESKLIAIHTYEENDSEKDLEILEPVESNFLHKSAIHFKEMIRPCECLQNCAQITPERSR